MALVTASPISASSDSAVITRLCGLYFGWNIDNASSIARAPSTPDPFPSSSSRGFIASRTVGKLPTRASISFSSCFSVASPRLRPSSPAFAASCFAFAWAARSVSPLPASFTFWISPSMSASVGGAGGDAIASPAHDTWMRSVTAYRDHRGSVTLMCTAQVLLEEHTPSALGNPCAMITTPFPEAMAHARSLLDHLDYRGFANFDAKVDPRDGSFRFLEVNPRIGRNNYYVTGAGANVARFIVADLIEDRAAEPVTVTNEIVYSVVPKKLLLRYITDETLRRHVKQVMRKGIVHPLRYRAEGPKRRAYVLAAKANHVKKFLTYYPRPTQSGF